MKTIILLLILSASVYAQSLIKYNESDLIKEFYVAESIEKSDNGIFVEVVLLSEIMFPETETHSLLYFSNDGYVNAGGYEKNINTGKIKIIPGSNKKEPIEPSMINLYKILFP